MRRLSLSDSILLLSCLVLANKAFRHGVRISLTLHIDTSRRCKVLSFSSINNFFIIYIIYTYHFLPYIPYHSVLSPFSLLTDPQPSTELPSPLQSHRFVNGSQLQDNSPSALSNKISRLLLPQYLPSLTLTMSSSMDPPPPTQGNKKCVARAKSAAPKIIEWSQRNFYQTRHSRRTGNRT